MVGGDLFETLVEGDFPSEDAGLDSPVRLAKFEPFQSLASFSLGKPTFQLLPFVRLQHGEPPFFRAMGRTPPKSILSSFLFNFLSFSRADMAHRSHHADRNLGAPARLRQVDSD